MLLDALRGLSTGVPSRCPVCARWPARPICGPCLGRFAQPRPRCARCALPVTGGVTTCGRCLRAPPPIDACLAALDYGYPWSAVVAQFKFKGQPGWARALSAMLARTEGVRETIAGCDIAVPMPLSRERLARRGFNQAHELARRIAPRRKVEPLLLLRVRDTPPQATLDRAARLANMRGAFAVDPLRAAEVRGLRITLVDDVMTSGASIFAAAETLRAAGCASVRAIVLARTPE